MRKPLVLALVAVLALTATPSYAWGTAAHRYIMRRAIDLLPPAIKPFFDAHRDELILRVVDPDLWRTAGWEDDKNHFVDFGVKEYGAYPFGALPREYGAAIEKFGTATIHENGTLPWRFAEEFGNLRRAFEAAGRRGEFSGGNVVYFSAIAAHYIQDATQPLHATYDYDGREHGQDGLHSRFETALFERYERQLTIVPPSVKPVTNARDLAFDTLLDSYKDVDRVLAADKEAVAGKDEYDDDYFDTFFAKMKPILEQRLATAISNTAGLMVGAWEAAGKPDVNQSGARRRPQKVKKGDARNMPPAAPAPRGR
ncbi:MAG TPA: hypothetical protein VFA59_14490 [Vicinamibacterales bacterium]|nr:hypothetical protein [Vicinamibacterales bacterium]